jgi:hypothetical protein
MRRILTDNIVFYQVYLVDFGLAYKYFWSFDFVTLYWFWVDQSLLLLINASCGEAANTNFTVFGLTRHGLKPIIYLTQD